MQPHHSYLVCATPRSGSTLFCEILRNSGVAGHPEEYFEYLKGTGLPRQPQEYFVPHDEAECQAIAEILDVLGHSSLRLDEERLASWCDSGYGDYLGQVIEAGTTPNGIFGAKMMWNYFGDFLELARQIPELKALESHELLTRIFPRLRFVWMTRQDKTRQAISLWKALQTQSWCLDGTQNGHAQTGKVTQAPIFCFGAIGYLEQRLTEHDRCWQGYFAEHGLQPLIIVYEELINDLEATMQRALRYLEIAQPADLTFNAPTMRRQADAHSEEWVRLYQEAKLGGEEAQETT